MELFVFRVEGSVVYLKTKTGKVYQTILTLYGLKRDLRVGDKICLSKKLFSEKYSGYSVSYIFGSLDSKYGRNVKVLKSEEICVVYQDDETYVLKRLFG